jgi:hypothetical protein
VSESSNGPLDDRPSWADASPEERAQRLDDLLGPPPTPEEEVESDRLAQALLEAANAASDDVEFVSYGGACPEQGYGWYRPTGEAVYFRYRHDFATLEVGPNGEAEGQDPMVDFDQVRLYAEVPGFTGNPWDGATYDAEATTRLLRMLVEGLRPKEEYADGTRKDRMMAAVREALGESD